MWLFARLCTTAGAPLVLHNSHSVQIKEGGSSHSEEKYPYIHTQTLLLESSKIKTMFCTQIFYTKVCRWNVSLCCPFGRAGKMEFTHLSPEIEFLMLNMCISHSVISCLSRQDCFFRQGGKSKYGRSQLPGKHNLQFLATALCSKLFMKRSSSQSPITALSHYHRGAGPEGHWKFSLSLIWEWGKQSFSLGSQKGNCIAAA